MAPDARQQHIAEDSAADGEDDRGPLFFVFLGGGLEPLLSGIGPKANLQLTAFPRFQRAFISKGVWLRPGS